MNKLINLNSDTRPARVVMEEENKLSRNLKRSVQKTSQLANEYHKLVRRAIGNKSANFSRGALAPNEKANMRRHAAYVKKIASAARTLRRLELPTNVKKLIYRDITRKY
jgi:hypothetical protein